MAWESAPSERGSSGAGADWRRLFPAHARLGSDLQFDDGRAGAAFLGWGRVEFFHLGPWNGGGMVGGGMVWVEWCQEPFPLTFLTRILPLYCDPF